MRSHRATHDLIAVSAAQAETGLNVYQALDLGLLVDMTTAINLDRRRESNADELTGKEEPDTVYDLGFSSGVTLAFGKAQPQHFAFCLSYALGLVATAASGAGYVHTITPLDGDVDLERSLPSFTAAQRYGKTVEARRYASMFVDQVTMTLAADAWAKISAQCKGTGKHESSLREETVSAAANATTLLLAANGVAGTTAQGRLDNVHRVRVELETGVWTEVEVTAVSSATPAELTITAPDAATDIVDYKILYAPAGLAWTTFPAKVAETPLRISQMQLTLGGAWDGTTFAGGRQVKADFQSLEWTLSNNLSVEFVPGQDDGYAGRCFREGRSQALKLNREMREGILQQAVAGNEKFGMAVTLTGAEFAPGERYQVQIVWPQLQVLTAPISVDGKRLAEAGDLSVQQHDTYGSVIVKVTNRAAGYAA